MKQIFVRDCIWAVVVVGTLICWGMEYRRRVLEAKAGNCWKEMALEVEKQLAQENIFIHYREEDAFVTISLPTP